MISLSLHRNERQHVNILTQFFEALSLWTSIEAEVNLEMEP